jgi:hypothetical protein
MKKCKFLAVASCLVAALFAASTSNAQQVVVAVGSSGIFNAMAVAAVSGDPITGGAPLCGSHFWTGGTGQASGHDGRSGVPDEPGSIWVAWDNSTTPTIVCAYLSVDSLVGQRLFFAQHSGGTSYINGTLNPLPTGTGSQCKVPDVLGDGETLAGCQASPIVPGSNLPAAIATALSSQQFNVAFTDIRPEDAQYFMIRANCSPATSSVSCMGYGPATVGTAVQSSYTLKSAGVENSAQVVLWNIYGYDPINQSDAIPAWTSTNVATYPVMVVVNNKAVTGTNAAGDFGSLGTSNVLSRVFGIALAGYGGLTTDIDGQHPTTSGNPLNIVLREPNSGTYNTVEWEVARERGTDLSQDFGVNYSTSLPTGPGGQNCWLAPSTSNTASPHQLGQSACINPLNIAGPNGSFRTRAIGTGEMVKVLNDTTNGNSLGYAFWGFSNYSTQFSQKANLKYLKVDGTDPLYDEGAYTGVLPQCTGTALPTPSTLSCPSLSFPRIYDGSYRIWSTVRATVYAASAYSSGGGPYPGSGPGTIVASLIQAAQDLAAPSAGPKQVADFIPTVYCANAGCTSKTTSLNVFRSHYNINFVGGDNGHTGGTESGGDVFGAIYNIPEDKDFTAFAGFEIIGFLQ